LVDIILTLCFQRYFDVPHIDLITVHSKSSAHLRRYS